MRTADSTGRCDPLRAARAVRDAAMNTTGNEKYDSDMQGWVFRDYLIDKVGSGALGKFVKQGKGTVDDAIYAASKEWASIAVPKN